MPDGGTPDAPLQEPGYPPPQVALPAGVASPEWAKHVQQLLLSTAGTDPTASAVTLPPTVAVQLVERVLPRFKAEPVLVEVVASNRKVFVVGDTHGQYHDVCRLFEVCGHPSTETVHLLNGDFVDRGAWGLETFVLFLCWKLALPDNVYLLRGNHESSTCTAMYGFLGELQAKYGKKNARVVYNAFKKVFAALPLAALVEQVTLVLHGGLFRRPSSGRGTHRRRSVSKRRKSQPSPAPTVQALEIGTLDDLRKSTKGGVDPDGLGSSVLATDVLWSDPMAEPGLQENDSRGVGIVFGPDVTQRFCSANGVRLIIRSHEGPDARSRRPELPSMEPGFARDHVVEGGLLMTVFSAPDYPQFQDDEERFTNRAAVAVLQPPSYAEPDMLQFDAVLPRPEVKPYFDVYWDDGEEDTVVEEQTTQ